MSEPMTQEEYADKVVDEFWPADRGTKRTIGEIRTWLTGVLRSRLADAERDLQTAQQHNARLSDTCAAFNRAVAELAGALRKAHNWMCRLGCPSAPPGVFYEWTGDREEIAAVLAKQGEKK